MALKNKSMYAILGILSLSPGTGYDIKKYCDRVLSGVWNENFGHIYPTLKKLSEYGWIENVSRDTSSRKVEYQITEKGEQEFRAWLLEETLLQPVRSEFMLKLLFSNSLPKEHIIRMLNDYKEIHEKKLGQYLQIQKDLEKGIEEITKERSRFIKAVLRKGIISCQGTILWCEEAIKDI